MEYVHWNSVEEESRHDLLRFTQEALQDLFGVIEQSVDGGALCPHCAARMITACLSAVLVLKKCPQGAFEELETVFRETYEVSVASEEARCATKN